MRTRIGVVCAFILVGALAASPLKADSISIQNASFETTYPLTGACGAGCGYNYGQIPGWTINGTAGSFQPNSTYFTSVPNGKTVAFISNANGTISQTLAVSLLPDTTYTLSVDVGNRLDLLETDFWISLDAGSTSLNAITGSNSTITPGTFANETFTYTTGSSVLPGDLTIILGSRGFQSNFDNVRLTTNSPSGSVPVPEPSGLLLLCMGIFCLALFVSCSRIKSQLIGAAS